MAYTVTFPTTGPRLRAEEVAEWLIERGEPSDAEGPSAVKLRALPVLVVVDGDGYLKAHIEVTAETPLDRLVQMVFALSMRAGADVRLVGQGELSRSELWIRLADEQDRLRLARAIDRAEEQGKRDEVVSGLWAVLTAVRPGHDIRWDAARQRLVELKEVDATGGIALDEARWHDEAAKTGDVLPVAVDGPLHVFGWRWLSEAHPRLTDP